MRNSLTLADVLNDLPDFSAMKLNDNNNNNNNNNIESSSGKVYTTETKAETIVPMIHNANSHTHIHEMVGVSSSGAEPEPEVEVEVEVEVEAGSKVLGGAELTTQEVPDGQTETITESNNELIESERTYEVGIFNYYIHSIEI